MGIIGVYSALAGLYEQATVQHVRLGHEALAAAALLSGDCEHR